VVRLGVRGVQVLCYEKGANVMLCDVVFLGNVTLFFGGFSSEESKKVIVM
jgi:hypothetical protein